MRTVLPFIVGIKIRACYYLFSHLVETEAKCSRKGVLGTAVTFDKDFDVLYLFVRFEK